MAVRYREDSDVVCRPGDRRTLAGGGAGVGDDRSPGDTGRSQSPRRRHRQPTHPLDHRRPTVDGADRSHGSGGARGVGGTPGPLPRRAHPRPGRGCGGHQPPRARVVDGGGGGRGNGARLLVAPAPRRWRHAQLRLGNALAPPPPLDGRPPRSCRWRGPAVRPAGAGRAAGSSRPRWRGPGGTHGRRNAGGRGERRPGDDGSAAPGELAGERPWWGPRGRSRAAGAGGAAGVAPACGAERVGRVAAEPVDRHLDDLGHRGPRGDGARCR